MADGNEKPNAAPVGRLQKVRVDQITKNERNPRQTFNPDRIEKLAASLDEIGLQVPITVYENPRRTAAPYVLLDGERRFRAAKLINWESIPALVVPRPTAKENAVRMFNIHMLREDWEEIETAWALEQIIKETGIDNDRELQKLTGLSIDRIRNMRRVLNFPKSVQEKVANDELPYQLLVELDKNVLSRRREKTKPGQEPVISMNAAQLRDVFLKKYLDDVEKDVVELRKVGTLYETAFGDGKVAERARTALNKLVDDPKATIEDAYDAGAASGVELSRVLRDMKSLPGRISDLLDSALELDQKSQVADAIKVLQSSLVKLVRKAA
jgi:ParB family chromosome partitioning protein